MARAVKKTKPSDDSYVQQEIDEVVHSIMLELQNISDSKIRDETMAALEKVQEDGDLDALYDVIKYRRTPVSLDEFLYSEVYLNLAPSELYPGVVEALYALEHGNYVEAVLKGAIGGGKALDVATPIMTSKGWKRNGDLVAGDVVYDEHGYPCTVTHAHPVLHNRPCYRVTFSDGESLVADADHQWFTKERTKNGKRTEGSIKTTADLAITVYSECGVYKKHSIPICNPLRFEDTRMYIDPYVLGCWLGDGHSAGNRFTNHIKDHQIIRNMEACGAHIKDYGFSHSDGLTCLYGIQQDGILFVHALRMYDLINNKHIPEPYLYGSVETRVSLLQGLLDTDGYARPSGSIEFLTKYPALASDFMDLAWSLGLKPMMYDKYVKGKRYFRITFTCHKDYLKPFRLDRKLEIVPVSGAQASRQRSRYVVSVEPVDSRPVRCISVDSPSHLYLAGRSMIPTHNSTIANIRLLRDLYLISCLRHPQITFGIQRRSSIVFTIQSVRLATAKKAVFQELGQYITNSPYFKTIYPYDHRISSEMIFREQNVTILPVSSSDTGAISLNVIGGVLDEMNFMEKITKSKREGVDAGGEYDQAKNLYNNLSKRRRSRFLHKGNLPGTLFLVSSSRYPDDFTETKAAESTMYGGDDPHIYVFSKSLWESKGRDRYKSSSFRVMIGNEERRSKILGEGEKTPKDMEVIEVPDDFGPEFSKDLDGSIRDLAGKTTLATRPFLRNREAIYECMSLAEQYGYRNAFNVEEVDLSVNSPHIDERALRTDVRQMRVCHVDLAVTRDAAGLAIGHIAGTRTLNRTNPVTMESVTEVLPVIAYDAILRIVPPPNAEIDFSKIRQVIFDFKEQYGVPIKIVTTDGFNSVDFKQILGKKGYRTDYLSVDRTTQPYVSLRDAFYDGRVFLPRHNFLMKELVELEYVRRNSKEKIDHKERGCFTGDTEVRLADGSAKRIDELPDGFTVSAYNRLQRRFVNTEAGSPRITKFTTELMELVLEDGGVIRCTPDHLFLLKNGTYKEAQYLMEDDELLSLT